MLAFLTLFAASVSAQALPPWMDGRSQPADLGVSVVTFSPGDTLTEWWGHTALVVEDRRLQHARLYNFGMFGPRGGDTAGFVKDFIKGRLYFWVGDDPVLGTYQFYRSTLRRDVRIQELDLEPDEAMRVARRLGTHVLPENATYLYHHYDDNCSTRPRDILDEALQGQLKAATAGPSRMTLRQHALRYAMVNPPMSLVLDFLQADSIDQPITRQQDAYLPDELERQLGALQVRRADGSSRPLVKRQWAWFESGRPRPPEDAPRWLHWFLLAGLSLALVGHGLGHWGRDGARLPRVLLGLLTAALGLVLGILGGALAFLMGFTDHLVAHGNENVLQAGPLSLALFPLGLMLAFGARRAPAANRAAWTAVAALSLAGVALKALPVFDQANWNVLAVTVPVNVGFAALWWLDARYRAARARPAGPPAAGR